jgi:hypothetical protein
MSLPGKPMASSQSLAPMFNCSKDFERPGLKNISLISNVGNREHYLLLIALSELRFVIL